MAEEYIIYKVTYKTNGSKEAERYVGFAAGDDLTESQSFLEKKVEAEGKRFYFWTVIVKVN